MTCLARPARGARRRNVIALHGVRGAVAVLLLGMAAPPAAAQIKSPAERIEDLEERIKDLEKKLENVEKEKPAAGDKKVQEDPDFFSGGVLTLGGTKLRFGGKAEFLFIDTESENNPVVGSTESPDPHLEIDRLRLEMQFILNREISVHSEIDFHPEDGDVVLKRLTARHSVDPTWWFHSRTRIGLDDRFIRPVRRTKNYPLIGTAFWRDQSIVLRWSPRFGDKDGEPIQVIEEVALQEEPPPEETFMDLAPVEEAPAEASSDAPPEADTAGKKKAKDKGKGKKKKAKDGGGGGSPPPAASKAEPDTDAIAADEPAKAGATNAMSETWGRPPE